MNAVTLLNRHAGYGSVAIRTERDTEYDAFSRVTSAMKQAANRADRREAIHAVHKNSELWTILAADLAGPDNRLPDDVKAGLISLAGFSIRHGHAVIGGTASVDPLIDINLSIMKGLRGEVAV